MNVSGIAMMSPAGRRCSIRPEYVRADNAIRMGYCCICRAAAEAMPWNAKGSKHTRRARAWAGYPREWSWRAVATRQGVEGRGGEGMGGIDTLYRVRLYTGAGRMQKEGARGGNVGSRAPKHGRDDW